MRRICAWCQKDLGHNDKMPEHAITHGICESCRVAMLNSLAPQSLNAYLNFFTLPVMMVDAEGRVLSANQAALDFVAKDLKEIQNSLGGNVMNCKYAFLEEGCGETEHCVGCTIRKNVIKTFETGESLHKVPAHLVIDQDGQEMTINFLISTEKVQGTALLRIDRVLS